MIIVHRHFAGNCDIFSVHILHHVIPDDESAIRICAGDDRTVASRVVEPKFAVFVLIKTGDLAALPYIQ